MWVLKRIWIIIIQLTLLGGELDARHITGGEMTYTYLGKGAGGSLKYSIHLKLYRDCFSTGAQLDQNISFTIFDNGSPRTVYKIISNIPLEPVDILQIKGQFRCIDNPPNVCYEVGNYTAVVDLPPSTFGYTIAFQRCCRVENISNLIPQDRIGSTYVAMIPGTSVFSNAPENSSPVFGGSDTVLICEGNPFEYDFSAYDSDGDRLEYAFTEAYDGSLSGQVQPQEASPPPYNSVPYTSPFSATSPMGANVKINPQTGKVSGIAPAAGIYVVTVTAYEYRGGKLIGEHRKDLQIAVAPCSIASAELEPEYVNCSDFTVQFKNKFTSPLIKTYSWDFGVKGSTADTSSDAQPLFTFPDTGVYQIRLIINEGEDCSDTAFSVARIFPGFYPGFTILGECRQVPIQFSDTSKTKYGTISSWSWNFNAAQPGYGNTTSTIKNPQYTYQNSGTYTITLTVTSTKGCKETVTQTLNVSNRPSLKITNDTTICDIDTLQLHSVEYGSVTWTPNYNINDLNSHSPLVSPDVSTTYYAKLVVAPGCENTDSVRITVKSFVTLDAGTDTTICGGDPVQLKPISDGLYYTWSPAESASDYQSKNPVVTPVSTTIYQVTASIGKCSATDQVTVKVVPYPQINAGDDPLVCPGESTQLEATGKFAFIKWFPAIYLSNPNITNPVATPPVTIQYIAIVSDTIGCPKPYRDTVIVNVLPEVPAFAGNDTAIVLNQPLQLNASGGDFYEWTPPAGLTDAFISNPVADITDDTQYILKVTTVNGCVDYDTIRIKVFKTPPDIFVPTAFTPNNDGLNDVLHAIPVGIARFDYFKIFNRWGRLIFNTSNSEIGWNGTISSYPQASDIFVWQVQGLDYTGKLIKKKGTVVLIR